MRVTRLASSRARHVFALGTGRISHHLRRLSRTLRTSGAATVWLALVTLACTPTAQLAAQQPPRRGTPAPRHVGIPAGWLEQYPCRPRLRPVVDAPRGAFTPAEACAASVAVYEAWIDAARRSTAPFTPAALRDTGRVDGVILLYLPEGPPDAATDSVAIHDTRFTINLYFGPFVRPVAGIVDPHHGVRRVYPSEPFDSQTGYDRALHRRPHPRRE